MKLGIFKRKVEITDVSTSLPTEVEVAIETASVIIRGEGDRALVHFRGYSPITYNLESANAFLRSAFSDLNDDQVARALRFLDGHVAKRVAMYARQSELREGGSRWRDWRPLDRIN